MSGPTGNTPFSFGKPKEGDDTSSNKFSFGTNNNDPPKFSFGGSSTKSETPTFSFGNITNDKKESATLKTPSLFGNSTTTSGFSFGKPAPTSTTTAETTTPFSFGTQKNASSTKPSLFGSSNAAPQTSDQKVNIFAADDEGSREIKKEAKKDIVNEKEEEPDLLKSYQPPSMNHLITNNKDDASMDVDVEMGDDKFGDEDEFFDIDIDEKTNLPIRKLTYDVDGKVFSKDRVAFAVSDKTEKGMLFVTAGEEKESQLFPFDLIPQIDDSTEYRQFLEKVYHEIEPLLEHRAYKHYIGGDEDEQIGVISQIRAARRERELSLHRIMSALLQYLDKMIKTKMKLDLGKFNDRWIVNFEECINVLYLMNALHFGETNETIVLLQQWIERVEIEPNEELLESVLQGGNIQKNENIASNPRFWSVYVKKLIMRGSFATLIDDLGASGYENMQENDPQLFQLLENMVKLISEYDPVKFSFDMNAFLRWKKSAVELREAAVSTSTENSIIQVELINLLSIISGSSSAIDSNANKWYDNLVARYLYQMPSKKLLVEYMNKSLADEGYEKPIEGVDSWEGVCIELIKGKFLTVISSLESFDKSIGTFVAILLTASGLLDVYSKDIDLEGGDIVRKRETVASIEQNIDRMIEDLALTFLNDQKLFAIGVGMMIKIGSNKCRETLAELLPKYEIRDSDDFEWVLSICTQLKLTKTRETIQKIQGEKFYSKELVANALGCFAEARSSEKVIATVWRLFEDTLLNKGLDEHLSTQLFESDVCKNNALLRQSLSPLYILDKVIRMDNVTSTKEQHDLWFNRLISLLDFAYLPAEYLSGLFLLVLQNLNRNVFALKELTQLIERLNRYEKVLEEDQHGDGEINQRAAEWYTVMARSWMAASATPLPETVDALLHAVRRAVALDVSFAFLEEGRN